MQVRCARGRVGCGRGDPAGSAAVTYPCATAGGAPPAAPRPPARSLRQSWTALPRALVLVGLVVYPTLWAGPFCLNQIRTMPERGYDDFGRIYHSNVNAESGRSLYAPSHATWLKLTPATGLHFLNMNPPHLQVLARPITTLPLELATPSGCS